MAYTKTVWQKGDVLTAEKLNKIENAIEEMSTTTGTIRGSSYEGNSSNTDIASTAYVMDKINSLDSTLPAGSSITKTLTALSIDNGKISGATFSTIYLPESQVTNLEDDLASKAPIASPVFTGDVTLARAPSANLHAATKAYVDGLTAASDVYNASTNKLATVLTVTNAINALDGGTITGTPNAGSTLTALSQTNGNISATFAEISIAANQVSGLNTALSSTNIETTTDESTIALAAGQKYKLTAGNKSIIFTMPSTGGAASAGIDTSISAGSTSTNVPTSQAVATFVEGKRYLTSHQSLSEKANVNNPTFTGTLTLGSETLTEAELTALKALLNGGE